MCLEFLQPGRGGLMGARVRRNYWLFGLGACALFMGSVVAYAQVTAFPTPEVVAKLADRNALLACVYIMAVVALGAIVLMWKIFSEGQKRQDTLITALQEQSIALTKFATKLDRAKCMIEEPPHE